MLAVRDARPADAGRLLEILRQSPEAGPWSAEDLFAPGRCCLVGEAPDGLAGFLLAACAAPGETEILALAVAPESRRKGLATALVEALRGRRPHQVFLEVRSSNASARKFYERLGFFEMGRRRDYYSSPREDALVLCLPYRPEPRFIATP
jgi:ribosomal-protein-alanine N-acetyltransferase